MDKVPLIFGGPSNNKDIFSEYALLKCVVICLCLCASNTVQTSHLQFKARGTIPIKGIGWVISISPPIIIIFNSKTYFKNINSKQSNIR